MLECSKNLIHQIQYLGQPRYEGKGLCVKVHILDLRDSVYYCNLFHNLLLSNSLCFSKKL